MLEWIPVEMRAMSVLSAILFGFGGIAGWYLHGRLATLEKTVTDRSKDITRLTETCMNTGKAVESIKEDNRMMIGLVREDNKTNLGRIDKNLAAINKQLYKGD